MYQRFFFALQYCSFKKLSFFMEVNVYNYIDTVKSKVNYSRWMENSKKNKRRFISFNLMHDGKKPNWKQVQHGSNEGLIF